MLYRNTYLEIDLDLFHNNVQEILKSFDTDFCFVLKANAYGHGLDIITKELNQYKQISIIAVATLNEAIKINRITNKEILILGYLEDTLLEIAVKNNFITTIFDLKQAKLINEIEKAKIFIKVDTGFHRLGKKPTISYQEEIIEISKFKNIIIEGIYTHLRLVDNQFDDIQYNLFKAFCNNLKDNAVQVKYESISDSIALTRHPNYSQNLYRIGSLMFGLTSSEESKKINVKPIQTLKSTVTNIISVDSNGFGYSDEKYLNTEKIATLSIGYSDGIPRNISNNSYVNIENHKCKIIGLPSMDQLSVDVSGLSVIKGSVAIIFGSNGVSLEELSKKLKTNKNDLISRISSRIPRVYLKAGKLKYIVDELVGEINEY